MPIYSFLQASLYVKNIAKLGEKFFYNN